MDHIDSVMSLVTEGSWLASVDICQAYHGLMIRPQDRDLLQFILAGKRYRFRVLPNGLSSGPRLFTRIMKTVLAFLRVHYGIIISSYIDDTILIGSSPMEVSKAVTITVSLLQKLGFTINFSKSVLEPAQCLEYLGFTISTRTLSASIPEPKADSLVDFCKDVLFSPKVRIRSLATLIGKMVATSPGNDWAKAYTSYLQIDKTRALRRSSGQFDKMTHLFQFWINSIHGANKSYAKRPVSHVVYTDASLTGWGNYDQTTGSKYGEQWELDFATNTHINVLELQAVFLALKHLGHRVSQAHIQLFVDNTTTLRCIQRGGSTQSVPCNNATRQILEYCRAQDIVLSSHYCQGYLNVHADAASRAYTDAGEWSLAPHAYRQITDTMGAPVIDLFASVTNYKCDLFVTRFYSPLAFATDAFSLTWSENDLFLFPPFSLAGRVIQKVLQDRTSGILVLPKWPTPPGTHLSHAYITSRPWSYLFYWECFRCPATEDAHSCCKFRRNWTKVSWKTSPFVL